MSDVKGMRELKARLRAIGETRADMRALQLDTIAEAHRLVHRKTGNLQRNIVPGELSDDHATVEARTDYAAAVEFGSKPHVIVPKRKKALAWGGERRLSGRLRTGSEATHFAKRVNHPGTKPYPYLVPGAERALKKAGILVGIVTRWNRAA